MVYVNQNSDSSEDNTVLKDFFWYLSGEESDQTEYCSRWTTEYLNLFPPVPYIYVIMHVKYPKQDTMPYFYDI